MTEKEKDQAAYERYRRYKRAKFRSDSEDFAVGMIAVIIVIIIIGIKLGTRLYKPLFLLRCVQLGISMADMEFLSIGLINDMYSESRNDEWKYCQIATQEDFDLF